MVYRVIICLFFCFVLNSCHFEKNELHDWMADNGNIKVLCTTAQVAELVNAVGRTHVDTIVLISGQNDPHSYQVVKGDDGKFRRADIVFYSGLQLERGSTVVRYLRSPKAVACTEKIAKEKDAIIWLSSTPDPHMWMDISLWASCVHLIAEKLSLLKPEYKDYFEQNACRAELKYLLVHNKLRSMFSAIPAEKRYLVTTHDAFHYFCRAYLAEDNERRSGEWVNRCIAPEGLAPESQISTRDLSLVVQYVASHHVRTVFTEVCVNKDSLRKVVSVCHAHGVDVELEKKPLCSDTMDDEHTYCAMMEQNAQIIANALRGKQ
jgi:manganese/zinc/iron transport system substrate-binding protein